MTPSQIRLYWSLSFSAIHVAIAINDSAGDRPRAGTHPIRSQQDEHGTAGGRHFTAQFHDSTDSNARCSRSIEVDTVAGCEVALHVGVLEQPAVLPQVSTNSESLHVAGKGETPA